MRTFIISTMAFIIFTSSAFAFCYQPTAPFSNDRSSIELYNRQMYNYRECLRNESRRHQREIESELNRMKRRMRFGY